MKKVNFKEIVIKDIEGREQKVDVSQLLGNQLYMEGQNIEECELGKRIYFATGEVELSETEIKVVKRFAQNCYYVMRTAIEDAIKV